MAHLNRNTVDAEQLGFEVVKKAGPGTTSVLRALTIVGAVFAAYTGFRLPSLWATTLYNISFEDSGLRRSLMGTVLAPIWAFFGYSYWVFATVAFLILVATLIVIVINSWRAKNNGQRMVALVWLFAPTGAYLFHEVGYLDQLIYLLLFLSVWLWVKTNPFIAITPVALSIFVHESALVATVPLLLFFVVVREGLTIKLFAFILPVAASLVVAFQGPWGEGQSAKIIARLSMALPFDFREDAVLLFDMGIRETWAFVNQVPGLNLAAPYVLAIGIFWILQACRNRGTVKSTFAVPTLAFVASISPFFFILGGYDIYRWVFLTLTNFAIVLYWWLGNRSREFDLADIALGLLPFAILFYAPLMFFDGYEPRSILFWTVNDFGFWDFPTS
jgi:hypothetical protein